MAIVGLLFRFEVGWEHEHEATRFLAGALAEVVRDTPVATWSAMRFGPTTYGIHATFPDVEGERVHVGDRIAEALRDSGILAGTPTVEGFDVVAPGVRARHET